MLLQVSRGYLIKSQKRIVRKGNLEKARWVVRQIRPNFDSIGVVRIDVRELPSCMLDYIAGQCIVHAYMCVFFVHNTRS